jgi:RNA polymerase sigma factor (sigma-70 family)
MPEHLRVERDEAVAIITIDRPRVLNALNTPVMDELRHAVLDVKHDEAVRVAIITGAGDKAFVAGADINELAVLSPAGAKEYAQRGQHVFDLIENMGKPVIAAVNGYALGGGCELSMAFSYRIAADSATFGQPEIDLGLIPGYGGTQRLARLVGRSRALDLILTGRRIKAAARAQSELQEKLGREPETDEVAAHMHISEAALRGALEKSRTFSVMYLEDMALGDEAWEQRVSCDASSPEELAESAELAETLGRVIDALSEKERLVISLYYYEELTQKEIAQILGVTEARVCQIRAGAIDKPKAGMKRAWTTD